MPEPGAPLPYKIAVLCALRDARGRWLLIHRAKEPNMGLYSPIGGKLDTASGESPARCAQREIEEEAGITVPLERLRLAGIISEAGFNGQAHWLMFWYAVEGAVEVPEVTIREGRLEWREEAELAYLPLPETDRLAIWPTVLAHEGGGRHGFFALHIDCTSTPMRWQVMQSQVVQRG